MYTVQSLYFILPDEYMNCWNSRYLDVTFLLQQDLHWVLWPVLVCNEQCIKMMQILRLHLKWPVKKLILHSDPWHDAVDPPFSNNLLSQCEDLKFGKCNDSGVLIGVIPDGGRHWCCCIDTWHVAQALLDVDAPVDRDYVKSDENRTQTFNCEQQSHKQGQKCLLNNNYI